MLLVVGATGQLGSRVVRHLRRARQDVRALVRPGGPPADDLAATGARLVLGDLRDPASLDPALDGVTAVLATANVVAPTRAGDTHAAVSTAATTSWSRGRSGRACAASCSPACR